MRKYIFAILLLTIPVLCFAQRNQSFNAWRDIAIKEGMLYDVRMYNAIADDSIEDVTKIQVAADSIAADGGGTLFFPPGQYEFYGDSVRIYSNTTIFAYGATFNDTTGGTTIFYISGDSLITFLGGEINGNADVDGGYDLNDYGIWATSVNKISITDMYIHDMGGNGILLNDATDCSVTNTVISIPSLSGSVGGTCISVTGTSSNIAYGGNVLKTGAFPQGANFGTDSTLTVSKVIADSVLAANYFSLFTWVVDTAGIDDGDVLAFSVATNKLVVNAPSTGATGGNEYADSLSGTGFRHDVDDLFNSSKHLVNDVVDGILDSLVTNNIGILQLDSSFYRSLGSQNNLVRDAGMRFQGADTDRLLFFGNGGTSQAGMLVETTLSNPFSPYAISLDVIRVGVGQWVSFESATGNQDLDDYCAVGLIYPLDDNWGPSSGGVFEIISRTSGVNTTRENQVGTDWDDIVESQWNWVVVEDLTWGPAWGDSLFVQIGSNLTPDDTFYVGFLGLFPGSKAPLLEAVTNPLFSNILHEDDELTIGTDGFVDIADGAVNWKDLDNIITTRTYPEIRLQLPDTLYCVPGVEVNVYYENIIFSDANQYNFWLQCDTLNDLGSYTAGPFLRTGELYEADNYLGWRWTPTADDTIYRASTKGMYWHVQIYPKWYYARDDTAQYVADDSMIVVVQDTSWANQDTVLIIGDSFANVIIPTNYKFVGPFKDLCGDSIVLIGTQESGTDYANEGQTGRSYQWFEENSDSPFYNGNGDFSMSFYLSDNSLPTPEVVIMSLSFHNDVNQYHPSTIAGHWTDNIEPALDTMVTVILADIANVQIGLCLPVVPGDDVDPGKDTFGKNDQWQHRYILDYVREQVLAKYGVGGSDYDAQVTLIPWQLNLDTAHNFPTTTRAYNAHNSDTYTVQSDRVHPADSGWAQLADIVYSWLLNKNNQ